MASSKEIIITDWMLKLFTKDLAQMLVFSYLYSECNENCDKIKVSISYLHTKLYLSKSTIIRTLKKLAMQNYIIKEKNTSGNEILENAYSINQIVLRRRRLEIIEEKGSINLTQGSINLTQGVNEEEKTSASIGAADVSTCGGDEEGSINLTQGSINLTQGDGHQEEKKSKTKEKKNPIQKKKGIYTTYISPKKKSFPQKNPKGEETPIDENKNKKYLPLARQLAKAVTEHKHFAVKDTPYAMDQWANHFRILHTSHKIPFERIEDMLDWYCDHINDPFVPVIGGGEAFKRKFIQLEAAAARQKSKQTRNSLGSRTNGSANIYRKGIEIKNRI